MKTQSLSGANKGEVHRARGFRIIVIVDAIFLGLFPMFFAILGFLGNFPKSFLPPVQVIIAAGWYAPLEWYIMNGRLIYSDLDRVIAFEI